MTKVVTGPETRLNHVHLFDKFSNDPKKDPAFSVMVMIPKSDTETIAKIRKAEKEAAELGKDKFGGTVPKRLSSIFKDADAEDDDGEIPAEKYPEQEGHLFAWVTKKGSGKDQAPTVLDIDGTEMFDSSDIYSGAYAKVSMEAFAYNTSQNKGVTFSLRAVKKTADGERLGPVDDPADDFADDDEGLL